MLVRPGALPRTPRLCGGRQRDIVPLDSLSSLRRGFPAVFCLIFDFFMIAMGMEGNVNRLLKMELLPLLLDISA